MRVNNTIIIASIASIPLVYIYRLILSCKRDNLTSRSTQTKDFPINVGCQTVVMTDACTQTLQVSSANTQTDDFLSNNEICSQIDDILCIDDIVHVEK